MTFSSRLNLVYIAASIEAQAVTEPWGTHPLIDPNYSSNDLHIKHDSVHLTRLEKTKLVADWDTALQNLRVCDELILPTGYLNCGRCAKRVCDELILPTGYLNCGRCAKCTITMTTLVALNALNKANIFPVQDISKEKLIKQVHLQQAGEVPRYLRLIPLLASLERYDLIEGIQYIITRFRWKDKIKKIAKPLLMEKFADTQLGSR